MSYADMAAFRILSLDGGGIRGVATAAFLAWVEGHLDRPIIDYFDLTVGTSTGGIIALGLAAGKAAAEVEKFYTDWGARIFTRNMHAKPSIALRLGMRALRRLISEANYAPVDPQWIVAPKYDAATLSAALHEVFGELLLGEADHRVIVPSVDLIKGQTVVFRTPHLPGMVRDLKLPIESVALASASPPTYFEPATITKGSLYADGGLWANNPALVGFIDGLRISRECRRDVDPKFTWDDIHILSLGTGTMPYYLNPSGVPTGIAYWTPQLLDVMGAVQSQGIDFQAGFIVNQKQYRRVDFPLPDRSFALDAIQHLDALAHIGRESAIEHFATIKSEFLGELAAPYVPFT